MVLSWATFGSERFPGSLTRGFLAFGDRICALIAGPQAGPVPYVRTVKTASGAMAVQIVHSFHRGSRDIEHIGSAHDDAGVELLKAAARQRPTAGQLELDLGIDGPGPAAPLEIASPRMGRLLDALSRAYDALGFPRATGHGEVFRQLVLARIIEPSSRRDSLRVLEEAGAPAPSHPTLNRRLPV